MTPPTDASPIVARVLPDVTGIDKAFDYLVPPALVDRVVVGSIVRVSLHGRRVGGWVLRVGPVASWDDLVVPVERLSPILKWSSTGPGADILDLAGWAAHRWGASGLRPFLVAASPARVVAAPAPAPAPEGVSATASTVAAAGSKPRPPTVELHCVGPLTDPLPLVLAALARGRSLVLHPSPPAARALAARLRRRGLRVAVCPDEWGVAAAGVDVVVGSRSAAWAPVPGLRACVVLDEHDDGYQEERSPTWHARDVLVERSRRAGGTCDLISPCPSATAVHLAGAMRVVDGAQHAWPTVEVDDRTDVEPWRRSLVGSRLIELLRDASRRVACVINSPGRARVLACRPCRALQRCVTCGAAVSQFDDDTLRCRRCGVTRPLVCQSCGSAALATVRPGVSRLREHLEAAANRPVVAVSALDTGPWPVGADVYVGTEALLHRARNLDDVVFLDFDAELLAPRYRAHEHAVALVVRAARLVGPASGGGRVLLQTHEADHPVVLALCAGRTDLIAADELARRRRLALPPASAMALVSGAGADDYARDTGMEWAPVDAGEGAVAALLRAASWEELADALAATDRPRGLRVAVDPPRI